MRHWFESRLTVRIDNFWFILQGKFINISRTKVVGWLMILWFMPNHRHSKIHSFPFTIYPLCETTVANGAANTIGERHLQQLYLGCVAVMVSARAQHCPPLCRIKLRAVALMLCRFGLVLDTGHRRHSRWTRPTASDTRHSQYCYSPRHWANA